LGRLQSKHDSLLEALRGRVSDHHRFMLKLLMEQLKDLEGLIGQLEERIDQVLEPFGEQIRRLDGVPGVDRKSAQSLIAETGGDMSRFPSSSHLCSWAGMCPGNHESAGKRKSGRTRPGNHWLRTTLVQCAWAASHTKASYLSSQYRRLASHRGRKRALIAVGHSILAIVYEMLAHGDAYHDLGPDWFDRLAPIRLQKYLVKRLEKLGYRVTLEVPERAA